MKLKGRKCEYFRHKFLLKVEFEKKNTGDTSAIYSKNYCKYNFKIFIIKVNNFMV